MIPESETRRRAQETRDEVYREYLLLQLVEGRPDDLDNPIEGHMGRDVTDADIDEAIGSTKMSREQFAEAEQIAAEEADRIAGIELTHYLGMKPGS